MNAITYLRRALKYVIQLAFLFLIVFTALYFIQGTTITLAELFTGERGTIFSIVIAFFALTYPFLGYTKKKLTFSASQHIEKIREIMLSSGYVELPSVDQNSYSFRYSSLFRRVLAIFEDTIVITTNADMVSFIDGRRKDVVRLFFRFNTFISSSN